MKLKELLLDKKNANRGTERGAKALENSLRKFGAGRSILIDKDGRVIAGNKTLQQAIKNGMSDIEVVQTDGSKLVAVQRTDLDLENDAKARELAYADNRIAEIDLEWDAQRILDDLQSGVELGELFDQEELDELLNNIPDVDFKEFDESVEKEVQYNVCPKCGHKFPK